MALRGDSDTHFRHATDAQTRACAGTGQGYFQGYSESARRGIAHSASLLALVAALGRAHLLNELGWIVLVAFVTGFLFRYAVRPLEIEKIAPMHSFVCGCLGNTLSNHRGESLTKALKTGGSAFPSPCRDLP